MSNFIRIGDIAAVQAGPFGTQLHKSEYAKSGIPMINAKNIGSGSIIYDSVDYVSKETTERLSRYLLKEGDVIFGRAGSIDMHTYIEYTEEGYFQGTNCIRIRFNDLWIARYASYYLFSSQVKKYIEDNAGGSVQHYITTDFLSNIQFPLPKQPVAMAVSKLLRLLDKKIILNNQVNDNLADSSE